MSRSVEMFEVKVPLAAIRRLSNEDRYAYYMLGHIFNELMFLQKLVGFSLPKNDDRRPARRQPEFAQSFVLFRMASSKIWEAYLVFCKKEIAATLRGKIIPHMRDGVARQKELHKAIKAAPWLSEIRNGLGFHFPTFGQWSEFTTPQDDWEDDSIFVGTQSGHTFYAGSEAIAQHWMFRQYGTGDLTEKVLPLINEMIDLLQLTNGFLNDILEVFITENMLDANASLIPLGKVHAPQHDQISLPFWTYMQNKQD